MSVFGQILRYVHWDSTKLVSRTAGHEPSDCEIRVDRRTMRAALNAGLTGVNDHEHARRKT